MNNSMDLAYKSIGTSCPVYQVVNNCENTGNVLIPSDWKSIGSLPQNQGHKQGKLTAIWVNPIDENDILIGTASSGLWKSKYNITTATWNWINLTDVLKLPSMGVRTIVVKPNDPNTIWIGTGDYFWNYGFGIFKTTDGGITWCYQPLPENNPWPHASDRKVTKIAIHPTDANKLIAMTEKGVYRTLDGGTNWIRIYFIPGTPPLDPVTSPDRLIDLRNMELDPAFPTQAFFTSAVNFQHAAWGMAGNQTTQCRMYKMNDIWTTPSVNDITANVSSQSINITTVLQQNMQLKFRPNGELIISCGSNGYLLKSTSIGLNAGNIGMNSFTKISTNLIPLMFAGGAGYWNHELCLDPIDPNHIYIGGTELFELKNGAFVIAPNYQYLTSANLNTHADIKSLEIKHNKLYAGCDGGIFRGTINVNDWETLNGDLSTGQANGLGVNKRNGAVISAYQDNQASIKNFRGIWNTTDYYGDGYGAEYEANYNVADQGFVVGNGGQAERFINDQSISTGSLNVGGSGLSLQTTASPSQNFGSMYIFSANFGNPWTQKIIKRVGSNKMTKPFLGPSDEVASFLPPYRVTSFKVKVNSPNTTYAGIYKAVGNQLDEYFLTKTFGGQFYNTFNTSATNYDPKLPTTSISATSQYFPYAINTIAIDELKGGSASSTQNANFCDRLWVGLSGIVDVYEYPSGNLNPSLVGTKRVYFSSNGAQSFTDVSKGLPVFPIIKLVFDQESEYLYAGTDCGVYVLDTKVALALQEWKCFSNNLPPTIITDMELDHCGNKIMVSTQGRGVGEFVQAQNLVNTFEDAELKQVYSLDMNYKQSGASLKTITSAERAALVQISSTDKEAALYARSILAHITNEESIKLLPSEAEAPVNKKAPRVLNYENFKPEQAYAIFPNPNSGTFKLYSYLSNLKLGTKLNVTDVTGRVIKSIEVVAGKNVAEVQIFGLSKGNYIVTLYEANHLVFTSQISIHD